LIKKNSIFDEAQCVVDSRLESIQKQAMEYVYDHPEKYNMNFIEANLWLKTKTGKQSLQTLCLLSVPGIGEEISVSRYIPEKEDQEHDPNYRVLNVAHHYFKHGPAGDLHSHSVELLVEYVDEERNKRVMERG